MVEMRVPMTEARAVRSGLFWRIWSGFFGRLDVFRAALRVLMTMVRICFSVC